MVTSSTIKNKTPKKNAANMDHGIQASNTIMYTNTDTSSKNEW